MLKHALTHSSVKPYECEHCDRTFADPARWRAHRRSHSNVRPFICHICGKAFREQFQLKKHIQVSHDAVRAFQCEHCEKSFVEHGSLKRHQLLHTGVKPFACSVCEKVSTYYIFGFLCLPLYFSYLSQTVLRKTVLIWYGTARLDYT